jgi:hypothetical protein
VRGRLLLGRLLGREPARAVAAAPDLAVALERLGASAYGAAVHAGMDAGDAARAVAGTALWHVRVLAGWLPPAGADAMRTLAAGWELANVEGHLVVLAGADAPAPYELGSLADAWPRVSEARSPAEVRGALATSRWGDPGGEAPEEVGLALRIAWARRVLADVPEAAPWAAGALALLAARRTLLSGRPMPTDGAVGAALGSRWAAAPDLTRLAAALPRRAAWPLEGVAAPDELWRAERSWWLRLERDGARMARGGDGRGAVVGVVALICTDALRCTAALELAGHGGGDLGEVLGALA